MANDENLKNGEQTQFQSGEEAVRNGKKGGIASGKSRRRKKHLQDTVKMLLSLPVKEGKLDPLTSLSNINGKNVTVEEHLLLKQIEKASKGDISAFNALMNLAASKEKPTQEVAKTASSGDDSFIEALNAKAVEVWNEETDKTDSV